MPSLELRIPPPVVGIATGLLMWIVASAWPFVQLLMLERTYAAAVIGLVGVLIAGAGIMEFHRERTTANPMNPGAASALVRSGVYRFTRNPMYFGFAIVLMGWAAFLAHPMAPLGVVGFVAYMDRFQIIPEERALRVLFGAEFEAYAARVRRWL